MKTRAWGWLATAVLAAGLNSNYHNGGLEWAHRIAEQVEHNSNAVLALATGRAYQFMAEAKVVSAHHSTSCPASAVLAEVRRSIVPGHSEIERVEEMPAREEAQLARLEVNRCRLEAQLGRLRIANFNPVAVRLPRVVVCPRVQVSVPRMPVMKMPAIPVVHVEYMGPGPV
jgi:hypothetical protein